MKKIIKFYKKYNKRIYIILLFIISAAIILNFFPKEGKFPYEYQKGSPWMHEDLISRFDFPLLKEEAELNRERDSLLQDFSPYFLFDNNIMQSQIESFKNDFDKKWDNITLTNPGSPGEIYYDKIKELLEFIYSKMIVEIPDAEGFISGVFPEIFVVNNNLGEKYELSEIFTAKTAYDYLIKKLDEDIITNVPFVSPEIDLRTAFDYNNYLRPNLFYDIERSENVKESLVSNISRTKGLVPKGIRIISKGDVINAEIFRKLESFRYEYETRLGESTSSFIITIGHIILVTASLVMLYLFLLTFRKEVLESVKNTGFILGFVVLMISLGMISIKLGLFSIYVVPFAILPLIIKTFFDARVALFSYLITILLVGFFVPNGYEFIFLQFVAGMFAIFGFYKLYWRSQLVFTSIMIILSYSVVYFAISIIQEGNIASINWEEFAWFGGNGLLFLLSFPLIYIFEKMFGFLSDVSLMELSGSNHPVLRKVAEEAPGTFQHSLQVANLAEEVVRKIGGNPLLCRVGALYHDIGKVENSIYFVENQIEEVNPHEKLSYVKSAEKIISHVTRGIEIAKKNKLPKPVIDFIPTHHGTSKAQYFYKLFIRDNPDKEDTEAFNYPGPKPFSKETAVLMMADSIEAASRSLKTINESALKKIIDSIINHQLDEGQFSNTDLTFRDIETAKQVFLNKLLNIYHARISYPK
ncbi:HD family phosphohydrolase [Bacteroidota bacterium]